jgi:hypothetical protein
MKINQMISTIKFKTHQLNASRLLQNATDDHSKRALNMKFQRKYLIHTMDYLKLYKIIKKQHGRLHFIKKKVKDNMQAFFYLIFSK